MNEFRHRLEAAVRATDAVRQRLPAAVAGIDHPRVREAKSFLNQAWGLLVTAAGIGRNPLRRPDGSTSVLGLVAQVLAMGAVMAGIAAMVQAWHPLTYGWQITVGMTVYAASVPLYWIMMGLDRRLGGRVRRIADPSATPATLAGLRDAIGLARRELGAAVLAYLSSTAPVPPDAAYLRWATERDRTLAALAYADLALCTAADGIGEWLATSAAAEVDDV
ncbi:hypothetical protein [Dactylosporangium sp. NPDC048998]|uniref:hypothetical protein n=1 Tax=Dactylosporangium sp. NPDC048998 TaxID=3363976 RepID=UPI0037138414